MTNQALALSCISRRRETHCLALIGVIALCLATPAIAVGPLDHLPDDAYGFVLVRNLNQIDEKIARLAKVTNLPLPQPLTFLRAVTGIQAGLDTQREALLGLLPGEHGVVDIRPAVFLPVVDYAKFVAPLSGDPTGDVCRVTILGEEVLVAKDGDFALLMNLEHEAYMLQVLQMRPEAISAIEPLGPWIARHDVIAVAMPKAISAYVDWQKIASTEGVPLNPEGRLELESTPGRAGQVRGGLVLPPAVLALCESEISAIACGVSLDVSSNLLVSQRILFADHGIASQIPNLPTGDPSQVTRWVSDSFVAKGGILINKQHTELVVEGSTMAMRQFPQSFGYQNLTEDDWSVVRESLSESVAGVRSALLMAVPGAATDPVWGNVYFKVSVDDVDAYFASFARSFELWNQTMAKAPESSRYLYEIEATTINGRRTLVAKADLLKGTPEDSVPFMKKYMEAMFGKDAILRTHLIQIDDHSLLVAVANAEAAAERLAAFQTDAGGQGGGPSTLGVLALVDGDAAIHALVSPHGCLAWHRRRLEAFEVLGGAPARPLPDLGACDPLAVSLHFADAQMQIELAVPGDTARVVAEFIRAALRTPQP